MNCVKGFCQKKKYKKLQEVYRFDPWHISAYELRKYLQDVAGYISSKKPDVVVDIGCGLGDMLRHTDAKVKIGMDIHDDVLEAAMTLDGDIQYIQGSFEELKVEGPIDYVTSFGFMHGGTDERWSIPYQSAAENNDIRHFIVDVYPEDGTTHQLHFENILPDNYKKIEQMGPYLGGRIIEVYEKTEG